MTPACDDAALDERSSREGRKELSSSLILSTHAAGVRFAERRGFRMKIRAGCEISYDCPQPTPNAASNFASTASLIASP
jgi:hypothetical protein